MISPLEFLPDMGIDAMRSKVSRWILPAVSLLAVAAVVGSSLSSNHYHFYSERDRMAFEPDPWHVAIAAALSASEGLVLWWVLRLPTVWWGRFLIGLVVFVPWFFVVTQPIGPHVPGWVMMNALWVALIVIVLVVGLIASLIWRKRSGAVSDV